MLLLLLCAPSLAASAVHIKFAACNHIDSFTSISPHVVVCPSSAPSAGSSVRRSVDPSSPSTVGPGWPGAPHAEGTPEPPKWLEVKGHAPSFRSRRPVVRTQHRHTAAAGRHAPQMNACASFRSRPSLQGPAHPPAHSLRRRRCRRRRWLLPVDTGLKKAVLDCSGLVCGWFCVWAGGLL